MTKYRLSDSQIQRPSNGFSPHALTALIIALTSICLIIALTALPLGTSKQFQQHDMAFAVGDEPAETLPNESETAGSSTGLIQFAAAGDSADESEKSDDSLTDGVPMDEKKSAEVEAMDVNTTDDAADSPGTTATAAADSKDIAADAIDDELNKGPSLLQRDVVEDTEDDEANDNDEDESETEDEQGEGDESDTGDEDKQADESETDENDTEDEAEEADVAEADEETASDDDVMNEEDL